MSLTIPYYSPLKRASTNQESCSNFILIIVSSYILLIFIETYKVDLFPHYIVEDTDSEKLSDLPKVTQHKGTLNLGFKADSAMKLCVRYSIFMCSLSPSGN